MLVITLKWSRKCITERLNVMPRQHENGTSPPTDEPKVRERNSKWNITSEGWKVYLNLSLDRQK